MKGISIIIPTYNRAELVKDALQSVMEQDFPGPLEIIVSDDGSTDGTLAVASSFGNKVKILKKPNDCNSQGASGARNRGILKATQAFICFLDSDDLYLRGHLQKMVIAIESDPELGFALCNSLVMLDIDEENKFKRWTKTNIEPRDINNLSISTFHFANTNGFIFKKEVFEKVGLFDEHYKNAEDTDMWMRINENFKGIHAVHYGTVIRLHNLHRLTDVPKQNLLQNHYNVFRNALRRYHAKGLNDPYRLRALWMLSIKYKISQWPVFNKMYKIISEQNSQGPVLEADDPSWKSLEYFTNSQ
ncbi:GT2 family glycosyltransferase [Gillisia sp. Hel_I_86]|uniref:glycosyltransferase family 2 protein n=1 Tax=Gillisia sp. Hel_I_86 TaxID=1249981 RepID=UPI00119AF42C|nr:glycosyltransferase family A protein [Gillisia sp. Hel_I_86]TVZ27529.1 GT2 family glycosyltransferase [Gillisia sp. Hel_I_86]